MAAILVVGHGSFGTTLLETARMLVGTVGTAAAVEFPAGTAVADLTERVARAIDDLLADGGEQDVLVLTDVAGGSPSRVALGEALAGRAEVVTGTNLPMLVDVLFAPAGTPADELRTTAVQSAQAAIRDLGAQVRGEGASA